MEQVNGDAKFIKVNNLKRFKSYEWESYLKHHNPPVAGPECFNQNTDPPVNEFQLKQKLEINSPDSFDFVHLATVVNYIGPRLQLRLDGCDASNDIFELVDSDAINPVNTHKTKNRYFAAPLRFRKDAASYVSFCNNVLKNSIAAPQSAFKTHPIPPKKNLFKVGMKLEAVDVKHPSNICPATISEVDGSDVVVHLDGWDQTNDFKCKYASRNLFPVGWCKKTGHPLQAPGPKETFFDDNKLSINSEMTNTATVNNNGHHEESESKSESTDSVRSVNQLSSKANNILGDISHSVHKEENYVKINKISLNNVNSTSVKNEKSTTPTLTNHSSSKLLSDNNRGVKRDHSQMNNNNNNTKNDSQTGNNTTTTMLDTNTITSSTTQSFKDLFENVPDKSIVESWTVDDVIAFLNAKLSEFHRYESQFRVHEIDGKAFLLLTNDLIMKHLKVKLGLSLKIVKLLEEINLRE